MNKLLGLAALSASAAAFVFACSSDSTTSSPAGTSDAGGGAETSVSADGSSGSDTGTVSDAGTSDSGACSAYTGAIPNDAGAQCHDLVTSAPSVTVTSDPGTLPVGTGGTVADGLYYLTEARIYPGSPVPAGTKVKYAVLVVGDISYVVDDNNPSQQVRRTTKKNPDGGAGIILCETKVDNNAAAGSQTATCAEFTSFDSNSKFSTKFTKQ